MRPLATGLAAFLVGTLGFAGAPAAQPSTAAAARMVARQYDYAVTTTQCKARAGTAATSTVDIEGRRGWHLNQKAPVVLKFAPPSGIVMPRVELRRADARSQSQERLSFAVTLTPLKPERTAVAGEARFVVCQPGKCKPVVEPIRIDVVATVDGAR